jgi:WD40 repeat protein
LHWAADGSKLAAGELSTVETIEVFDFYSRSRLVSTNTTSGNDAFTVAIDPTGRYVAAGSKHLLVVVYDMKDRRNVFGQPLHRGFVSALAWSPDGKRLASASHDGTIRVFSPVPGNNEPGLIFSGHRSEVNALAWTKLPTANESGVETTALFSGGADGTLRAWMPSNGRAFSLKDKNWIAATHWSPDGSRIAVANFRKDIYLSDPASGLSVPISSTHANVYDVAWSPRGDRLATASRGFHCVEVIDVASGRSLGIFGLPNAYRVAWSPSGRYLAACGVDGARVWDTKTGALEARISRSAGSVLWHPDERRIVLGGDDGAIELWDAFTGKITATWRPPTTALTSSVASDTEPPRRVFDLRWSPDARWLAFATQDSVAGILAASDGRLVRTFAGHTSGIWRVVWNADGRRLATAGQDGMLRVYDAVSGGQVAHINHGLGNTELNALDWSRDGRRLVSGGFDQRVRMWDAQRGERIDSVEQLALATPSKPTLETLRKLASRYTELGWADEARETFRQARDLAPNDAALVAAAGEAETSFGRALDLASFDNGPASGPPARIIALLTGIYESWEKGKSDEAIRSWQELTRLPGAAEVLPLVRNYFSRARWSVTWFPSKVDPIADPAGWRTQATSADAAAANVRALCFPYLHRSPKELLLSPELTERGPDEKNFGAIAHAQVNLPAGKWRFRVAGGNGSRVLVNGQPVIDNWTADAPPEKTADFEQTTAGTVEITVEHFVREGTDGFQFQMEPVGK